MPILQFISGAALLAAGKKIYWFLFAVLTFLVSTALIPVLLPYLTQKTLYITAAVISGLLVILVFVVKKVAIGFGGFIGGGFLLLQIYKLLPMTASADLPETIIFVIGGVVGVLLAMLLFDLTILLLSIFTGAFLIMDLFTTNPVMHFILLILLCLLGTYLQVKWNKKSHPGIIP